MLCKDRSRSIHTLTISFLTVMILSSAHRRGLLVARRSLGALATIGKASKHVQVYFILIITLYDPVTLRPNSTAYLSDIGIPR